MSKERFYKVYSNIPVDIRKEIIAVIEGTPITWDVAYSEIEAESPLGEKVLKKLVDMEII